MLELLLKRSQRSHVEFTRTDVLKQTPKIISFTIFKLRVMWTFFEHTPVSDCFLYNLVGWWLYYHILVMTKTLSLVLVLISKFVWGGDMIGICNTRETTQKRFRLFTYTCSYLRFNKKENDSSASLNKGILPQRMAVLEQSVYFC